MKKGIFSVVLASTVLGAASYAFAGAYGEVEQAEEIPAPAPAAVPAPEPEEPRVMRKFSGFLTDAETTRGLWIEIGSVYAAEYDGPTDADAVNTYAHLSYGQEMFEVGALIPYIYAHQDHIGSAHDFGDLRVWGKVVPVRTDMFTFGLGLITSFPTAGTDNGTEMGTDEYGFEPFVTFGVLAGPASIRTSLGYNVYTTRNSDDLDDEAIGNPFKSSDWERLYDNVDLNVGVLVPVGEMIVVRAELTYNHFVSDLVDAAGKDDPTSIFPGADISFPIGTSELVLRPTVGIGLFEAPEWQAGLGIAFNVGI